MALLALLIRYASLVYDMLPWSTIYFLLPFDLCFAYLCNFPISLGTDECDTYFLLYLSWKSSCFLLPSEVVSFCPADCKISHYQFKFM